MTGPKLTEERLKCWLDANQAHRERLCVHLLPLLGNYTQVAPRRPKGGPDGARDLQAVVDGALVVWGAVGFQNSAADSPANKAWAQKKFKSDLKAAIDKNEDLEGFVFFTNIDLTPNEQNALRQFAFKQGITHCEVFYRERIRQILDSPEGIAYRLQYLDIPMTLEEQIAFVQRLQKSRSEELAVLTQRQEDVRTQVSRLEFLNECLRPMHEVAVAIKLKRDYHAVELNHFRVVFKLLRTYDSSPVPFLAIGGRDAYMTAHSDGIESQIIGVRTLVWDGVGSEKLHDRMVFESTNETSNCLWFKAPLYRRGPFNLVGDLDRSHFDVFMTAPLLSQVEAIVLLVNRFAIVVIPRELMAIATDVGIVENSPPSIPFSLSQEEQMIVWKRVYIRCPATDNASLPPPLRHAAREIDFSKYTPDRLPSSNPIEGPMRGSAASIIT